MLLMGLQMGSRKILSLSCSLTPGHLPKTQVCGVHWEETPDCDSQRPQFPFVPLSEMCNLGITNSDLSLFSNAYFFIKNITWSLWKLRKSIKKIKIHLSLPLLVFYSFFSSFISISE